MNPDDDPEARIRELERPLGDVARTSELGTAQQGGYNLPPMPPPVTYDTPFPTTPMKTSGGFPWWWIVVAAIVLGAAALAAGIAVFSSQRFSTGGPVISLPTTWPRASGSATRVPTTGASPSTPPPGGNVGVAGIGENKTIVCNDSIASVSGFSNTVVITGHCASLNVSGGQNVVTVDAADTIIASGFNNKVTYHSGSPTIEKAGDGNVVEQG